LGGTVGFGTGATGTGSVGALGTGTGSDGLPGTPPPPGTGTGRVGVAGTVGVGSVGSGGAAGVGGETPTVALPLTDTVLSPRPGALDGAGVVVGAGPVDAVVVAVEEPVTVARACCRARPPAPTMRPRLLMATTAFMRVVGVLVDLTVRAPLEALSGSVPTRDETDLGRG
jgi:hypothetical protein